MLRPRQLIPALTLHAPDGRTIRACDFKQKKNLVIAFLDTDCISCLEFLQQLAARASDLREKEAVALVVFLEPPSRRISDALPEEVHAGSDMPGRAARAYLGEDAFSSRGLIRRGVFVADRYGELFAEWVIAKHEFPEAEEVLDYFDQIEMAYKD
jgi:peroxiredoxin